MIIGARCFQVAVSAYSTIGQGSRSYAFIIHRPPSMHLEAQQCSLKLSGRRSQQPFGLDAHLDGLDQIQRRGHSPARCASARLAIDGDDLALAERRDAATHPQAKRALELLRIDQREHPLEGLGQDHPILEAKKLTQLR